MIGEEGQFITCSQIIEEQGQVLRAEATRAYVVSLSNCNWLDAGEASCDATVTTAPRYRPSPCQAIRKSERGRGWRVFDECVACGIQSRIMGGFRAES